MSIRGEFRSQMYTEPKRPNWWLRFASYRAEAASQVDFIPFAELDRIRRSQLTAWVLLGLFLGLIGYAPVIVSDIYSAIALCTLEVAIIIALLFNRSGRVTTAGIIVVVTLMVVTLVGPVGWGLGKGGLLTDLLPDFDYLAGAALLAATTLPPRWVFIVIPINIVLMLLCWNLLPHAPDLLLDQTTYPSQFIAAGTLIGRPIGWNIILGLIVYFVVRGYNQASIRMYTAMSIAEDRTDLAAAMQRTAQEQEMIQHYQDIFFTAIARYVSDRTQGIINSIALNFRRPQSALEEHTQLRVAAEARRLNTFFKRLDTQEERRIWDIRQIMSALRNYNYILSMILEHPERADIGTIHPKRTIHTNNSTIDTMFSLIFATVAGAEPWHLLTKSQLQFTNPAQYVETTRRDALEDYHHANRGNPPSRDSAPLQQQPISYPGSPVPGPSFPPGFPATNRQTASRLDERTTDPRHYPQRDQAYPDESSTPAGYTAQPPIRNQAGSRNNNSQDDLGWPSLDPVDEQPSPPWLTSFQPYSSEQDGSSNRADSDQYSSWRPPSEDNNWT